MSHLVTPNLLDDAADTLRLRALDPDATSIYDLRGMPTPAHVGRSRTAARRRRIRQTQQAVAGLREALAAGWDVGPELAFEEQQLAALESAS